MSRMFAADTGSTASNGSSSTSSRGACTSAHASATFLVMPAEYSTTSFVASAVRSRAASRSVARAATVSRSRPCSSPA